MDIEKISDWNDKGLNGMTLNELSDLQYVLECLPDEVVVSIELDNGDTYDCIEDYIEKRTEEFFDTKKEDYEKIVGKCFINDTKDIVVKVVSVSDKDDYEFLYEEYEKYRDDNWHNKDYIWLQEHAKGRFPDEDYLKYCLTTQTEMNVACEEMYHLGRDGNLYVDISCGGDYMIFTPMTSNVTFEMIREEAIKNDGEYKPNSD